MSTPDDLRTFGDSADALEARIASAEAGGTPVPPEARAMLESLRQLARAIDDLQASLGIDGQQGDGARDVADDAAGDAADDAPPP